MTVLGGGRVSGFLTVTDGLVVNAGSKITGETSIIGGLYATGISTFTSNSLSAVQFNVSGVSTFASSKTATGFTTNTTNTNLNVTGVATVQTLETTNLSGTGLIATGFIRSNNAIVTGLTTVSTGFGTNVTNTNLTVTGISTFASSKTATGFTTNTTNTNLNVTGVGTFVGLCTAGEYGGPTGGRWQVGASATAHYTFTGPGFGGTVTSDPTLYLARGQTYYFNNTSTAQLRIQTGTNGSVSSQWNVGVTNNDADQNVQLQFEVPYSAPNTLYYQATNFNTMGGSIVIYPSI